MHCPPLPRPYAPLDQHSIFDAGAPRTVPPTRCTSQYLGPLLMGRMPWQALFLQRIALQALMPAATRVR